MEKSVKNEIEKICKWYENLPRDYNGINELMYYKQRLIGLSVTYQSEVNKNREIMNLTAGVYEKNKMALRRMYLGNGVGKAETISRAKTADLYIDLKTAETEYFNSYDFARIIKEVVNAFTQQIATLRHELENKY